MRRALLFCLLWALPAAAGAAEDIPAQLRQIAEKVETLKRKTRDPLREQIEERKKALEKEADLKNVQFLIQAAQKAYDTKVATDAEILAARQAEEAAAKALPEVIKTRLAEDPNVQALERDLAAARAMDGQLSKEEDALKKQLYKLRDEVKSTPEVQQAREAAQQAEQAYYNMPRTHPKFVAAQQAIRDAQQALQARIRDLPEKKALDAAHRAYAELRNNSPEIRQAREAREAARQAYEQAIEHAIRTSVQGAAITRRLEEIDEQDELAEAQQRSIQEDLERVRREAQKADPEIAKAQKAYSEAHAKYKQVMHERAGDEAKALAEARQDLGKRLHDKMTTDATILDLQDRLKKVLDEINVLYGQQRELYRKNAANRRRRE